MASGGIRVLRAIPGSFSLGSVLRDFARNPDGIVTSFNDAQLPIIRHVLGDDSSLEVTSFSEVVRSYLVMCGEEVFSLAQSGHKLAAIAHACSLVSEDSPFAASKLYSGTHEAIAQTLDELHLWGYSAEVLQEVAQRAEPTLAAILDDLARIDLTVNDVLDRLGRQQHTYQMRSCLGSSLELEDEMSRLLVFAGADESPTRMEWLDWLAGQGVEVTIVLDRHATDAPIFDGAQHIIQRLGIDGHPIGPMNQVLRNLFAHDFEPDADKVEVAIISASDPLAEVEWALRGCLQAGELHRTGIYVRNLESYAALIEAVALRLNIPIRMARRAPLLTNSFARLTLGALEFCTSNDVRTLNPILKSSYLRLPGLERNEVESRLQECYRQRSNQWQELEKWTAENADRFEWLLALLEWRRRAIEGSKALPEWYGMLQELNRDQRLPWARLENKGGAMDERDRRALNQLERLLANHASVDAVTVSSELDLTRFVVHCRRKWEEGDVSIPTGDDGIRIVSDPGAFGDLDYLHVLGMLEGVFPRRRSEDPILSDFERQELSALCPDLHPILESHAKARAERDEFYRVCAAGQKKIVFSYPQADDQRDNIPAFYLTEIGRAAGEDQVYRHDYPRMALAPAHGDCVAMADAKLQEAIDGPRELPLGVELSTAEAKEAIARRSGEEYRPDELRDVLQCPFKYAARNRLHLHVNRQTERWGSLRKLPQVAQLLDKEDLDQAERALHNALDAELDRLYADVPAWEMQLLKTGGERLILDCLQRESLSRENWSKEPGSVRTNVNFGSHGVGKNMPKGVTLTGSIPGLSRLERYNVAHLYGSVVKKTEDLTDTDALYYGLHLMAIYEQGREGALEIDTMSGKRTLLVLGRGGSRALISNVQDGLQVLDLNTEDDIATGKKKFYDRVKKALGEAVLRIEEVRVDPIKGDHCDWCDFGELCRRSREFGEDDSPFGVDLGGDDES